MLVIKKEKKKSYLLNVYTFILLIKMDCNIYFSLIIKIIQNKFLWLIVWYILCNKEIILICLQNSFSNVWKISVICMTTDVIRVKAII